MRKWRKRMDISFAVQVNFKDTLALRSWHCMLFDIDGSRGHSQLLHPPRVLILLLGHTNFMKHSFVGSWRPALPCTAENTGSATEQPCGALERKDSELEFVAGTE